MNSSIYSFVYLKEITNCKFEQINSLNAMPHVATMSRVFFFTKNYNVFEASYTITALWYVVAASW